jgi:hypothetical protein
MKDKENEHEIDYKPRKMSQAMFYGGFLFYLSAIAKYYIISEDLIKLTIFGLLGLIITTLGWLHSRVHKLNSENRLQWRYMDELIRTKNQKDFEKIKEDFYEKENKKKR